MQCTYPRCGLNCFQLTGRRVGVQSRFRKLSLTAVGGADAEKFSIGAEDVAYEGPMQLRLQVLPVPVQSFKSTNQI